MHTCGCSSAWLFTMINLFNAQQIFLFHTFRSVPFCYIDTISFIDLRISFTKQSLCNTSKFPCFHCSLLEHNGIFFIKVWFYLHHINQQGCCFMPCFIIPCNWWLSSSHGNDGNATLRANACSYFMNCYTLTHTDNKACITWQSFVTTFSFIS